MLKKISYIFLLFISIKAVGQRTNSSPYSFFGIGQQFSSQSVEQASMGGIGVAFSNEYHINFLNPAANSVLRLATYTFGMNVNDLTIKDASGSQKSTSTSLSYVNIGFPVSSKAAMAFGLKPNTSVGYSLLNITNDINGDPFEATRFYGSGGTSKIYGAFGMEVLKGFSVGLEGEYVFGTIDNNILSQRVNTHLGTTNVETVKVRGTGLKVGIHYKKELGKDLIVNVGSTLKLENTLTTSGSEYLYSVLIGADNLQIPRDTLYANTSLNGSLINPLTKAFGAGLGKKNKWYVGAEYTAQQALKATNSIINSNSSYRYGNSSKFSVGGFYLPKANSISSYWDRVTYRAGVRFENTGLLINSTGISGDFNEINDFGISFGLGLPLKDISNLNLGVEYGSKGTTNNNLIKENYFNFKLSLSLNAVGNLAWFRKRKID